VSIKEETLRDFVSPVQQCQRTKGFGYRHLLKHLQKTTAPIFHEWQVLTYTQVF